MFKYLLLTILLVGNISASATQQNNNFQNELHKIKTELAKIKSVQDYVNDKNKINELEKSIKELEEKLHANEINKNVIDKDFEKYNEIINRQDERITDINSNTNYWGIGFSFIGILTGLFVFIINRKYAKEAKEEAKKQANEEVKKWVDEKADIEFKSKMEEYLKQTDDRVREKFDNIDKRYNQKENIMNNQIEKYNSIFSDKPLTKEQKEEVTKDAKEVKKNKEEDYTCSDWYKLFIEKYINNDFENALVYINKFLEFCKEDVEISKGLFAKALVVGKENPQEEITIYNELLQRFRESTNEVILEQVAKALFNKANNVGKENPQEAITIYNELLQRFSESTNEVILQSVASTLINKIETMLILDEDITTDVEKLKNLTYDIYEMMKVEMLEIFSNSKKSEQDEEIKKWLEKYKDSHLDSWGFDELKSWAKNMKDKEVKERILKYIKIFETKIK